MKITRITFVTLLLLCLFATMNLYADSKQEKKETFDRKEEIRIKLVLGDCYIEKSNDDKIHAKVEYTYDDYEFEAIFKERERYVLLQEKFHGDNPRGDSKWTIAVPNDIEIDFESATGSCYLENVKIEIDGSTGTGEFELSECRGEFDLNSGTGNVELSKCEGEFKLNSGTGHVKLSECDGEFKLNSGTGKVIVEDSKGNIDANSGTGDAEIYNFTFEYEGDINSGTGDAQVTRPLGDDFDLSINSGTGDALLDMDGVPIEGYFEFTAHARKGRIVCPVEFDDEEEYWENDNKYMRKSFTKKQDNPRYFISTGTGKAQLKK